MFPTRTQSPLPILIEVRNLHMADEDSCCSRELAEAPERTDGGYVKKYIGDHD